MPDVDAQAAPQPTPPPARGFARNARIVGVITLVSRLLGMAREVVAAAAFGAGPVWDAFTFAFTIPNLFRKLFGEGAISAAFIPLYGRLVEANDPEAGRFAAQAVNGLVVVLTTIVLVGEALLAGAWLAGWGDDADRLAIVLMMVMLPYVVLICGAAFLGGALNVHGKFAAPAAASVLLNLCLIIGIGIAWSLGDLSSEAGRARATMWVAGAVVVSGVLQVAMLLPSLRAAGVAFAPSAGVRSAMTRRMVELGVPVALSAAVLQISVLLDKGLAFFLADETGGPMTGLTPLAAGAAARLNWAQFLYQFPLGVFAIALATAIFPSLSRDAAIDDGRNEAFRNTLRRGIEAALFIGLPASAGLMLVSHDATRVLFERGRFTPTDTKLVAMSVLVYSAAVWAFSLQQIVNRAYYALHETRLPMLWAAGNLTINLAIELPLLWWLPTGWGEVGMACGTFASFSAQSLVMLWQLSRRTGGLGLRESVGPIRAMLAATLLMSLACWPLRWMGGDDSSGSAIRLGVTMLLGAGVYFGVYRLLSGRGVPLRRR